jgi:hypothetical protein
VSSRRRGGSPDRDRRGVLRGHALQRVRAAAIRRAAVRCQRCGRGDVRLVVHHLGELADYSPEATRVLCERCYRDERTRARLGQSSGTRPERRQPGVALPVSADQDQGYSSC